MSPLKPTTAPVEQAAAQLSQQIRAIFVQQALLAGFTEQQAAFMWIFIMQGTWRIQA